MARKRITANAMRVHPRMNIESEQKSSPTPAARNIFVSAANAFLAAGENDRDKDFADEIEKTLAAFLSVQQ